MRRKIAGRDKVHKALIGTRGYAMGHTIYHADTGVSEKNEMNQKKAHKLRKAMGMIRGNSKVGEGHIEKMYEVDDGMASGRTGL